MPRRTDLNHVLVIGSGPIVIGQACEFDYSGTQACRVLRSEGLTVSLVNSNPATIMTDPEYADYTYVEPITPDFVEKVIAQQAQRGNPIDALLATLGGQTALNTAVSLYENGALDRYGVELIGADFEAIQRGEDRQKFKDIVAKVGGESAKSRVCFTMGGLGSGMAKSVEDVERMAGDGLAASPSANVLIEESIYGWKEYELELMRDGNDNVVVVCSIENVDPMGVHTGDSVTVAPAMTLTDREYQVMRDLGIAILREVGVDTGGCNIQFAVDPADGRLIVIEMNPRVSRSSALASKATGFPIAKIAAKLAIGYTLDEILNDITKETPACFEPTLDYVVVKAPRFAFEKFPDVDHHDEVGGRGNVVGPQLYRSPRQGDALAGDHPGGVLDRRRRGRLGGGRPDPAAHAHRGSALRHRTGAATGRGRGTGRRSLRGGPVVRRTDQRSGRVARATAGSAGPR
jgi:carbamoyl-phosphate synthase large subunit